jgi:hypothetical protein
MATRQAELAMEARMILTWLGVILFFCGVLFMAAQPLWRGRLSGGRIRATNEPATLEPPKPATGFSFKSNWPGLALVAIGAVLLLAAAAL